MAWSESPNPGTNTGSKAKELSKSEIYELLAYSRNTQFVPKINPAFTRAQYELIGQAYQDGLTEFTMPESGRLFIIQRSEEYVFVGPKHGFVPCGSYRHFRFADMTAQDDLLDA